MNVPRPKQRKTKNSKRRFRLAVFAGFSILLASSAKSADTGLSPDTPKKSEAVQRATSWLVDQQLNDGTWPGRGLANTALSTLSVADGAGPFWCGEPFLNSVRRGRQAMLERLNTDLDVCFQSDPIGFSVAVYSLAATSPVEGEEEPGHCLDKAVETICRWQRDDGSWRFESEVADARSDAFLTGQCWVYAGLVTTLARTCGVPARPVTNYGSGHDRNRNKTIDIYYGYAGFRDRSRSDSTWNFHVWTECWMARGDVENANGWQVVDGTPQEISGGKFQCGPAPRSRVKNNQGGDFDVDFVFAEVAADVRIWQDDATGVACLLETQTNRLGHKISTKQNGTNARLDLTGDYK